MKESERSISVRGARPSGALPRPLCDRCLRPIGVCYCAFITPLETRTRVLILRHPREREVGIGTARMAYLSLKNASLRTDVEFSRDPIVTQALVQGPAYVLYPGPHALPVETTHFDAPITLIVLDGTWWQARKLLRKNPALMALPQLRMTPEAPSVYGRVRREPAADYVGTIEAIAHVLGHLEGDRARFRTMLRPLEALVAKQLHFTHEVAQSRHNLPVGRPRPRPPLPEILLQRAGDLVCIHGEANAWSKGDPHGQAPEIVHWLAERVATGERFEAILAPRGLLSPSTPRHLELAVEKIQAGESWSSFATRWQAFLKPSDLVLSWGHFALATLSADGFPKLPPHLDLRPIVNNHLGRRTGTVEVCATRMQPEAVSSWGQGRGGRRLGLFLGIVRNLLQAGAVAARNLPSAKSGG